MTLQSMLELLRKQPFQPFRLIMLSGQAYKVPRRDMAFLTKFNPLVGIDDADEGLPVEVKVYSLDHIARVEPLNDQANYP